MRILALDGAEYKVGFAIGVADQKPAVGLLKLREKDQSTEDAAEMFSVWLDMMILQNGMGRVRREDELHMRTLIAMEHFLPSGAMKGKTTADTREGQVGLNYAARAVAAINGVPFRSPAVQTIRKHFCGRAFAVDGDNKGMVIKQAQLLGYIPRDCFEDNMADACALYDFASSHWGSKAAAFQLMGERA